MHLVSYAYFESDTYTNRYIENLKFFLKEGYNDRDDIHYLFVIQGGKCSVDLKPERKNVFVLRTENNGYDLGAHGKGLRWMTKQLGLQSVKDLPYDDFMFLNCGQRGPFMPVYWPKELHWSDAFRKRLGEQSKPGLVSTSMFFHPDMKVPVAETWAFMLAREAFMDVFHKTTVFNLHATKLRAVVDGEDTLTPYLVQEGYDVGCLLYKYRKTDWSKLASSNEFPTGVNHGQIPSRPGHYEGIDIHQFEGIFHKYFWNSIPGRPDLNAQSCPTEERYTQWAFDEPEESRQITHPRQEELSTRDHDVVFMTSMGAISAVLLALITAGILFAVKR